MNKSRPATTIFKTCPNGHETTLEEHFIYDAQNRRVCRQCAVDTKTQRVKKRGAFG